MDTERVNAAKAVEPNPTASGREATSAGRGHGVAPGSGRATTWLGIILLASTVSMWLVLRPSCAPVNPGAPTVVTMDPSGGDVTVVSVGDILLGDAAGTLLKKHGYLWPFARLRPLIQDADLLFGNLEAPITDNPRKARPHKRWSYKMHRQTAEALAQLGFDAVCLANNHVLDYGPRGLSDTIDALEAHGIQPFGGGMNEAGGRRGVVFDMGGFRIGLLGYYQRFAGEVLSSAYASRDRPGPAMLTGDALEEDIDRMRRYADVVIVNVHWGANYKPVTRYQREMGRRAIAMGADIVNGHHPHIAQGIEVYRGKPIVYSVGNFTFGTPGRFPRGKQGYGLVVRYVFRDGILARLLATPIAVNNKLVKFQPRRVPADEARSALAPRLRAYGTRARWEGDTAVIEFGNASRTLAPDRGAR